MNTAFDVLVIILSVLLGIFLIVAIIGTVMIMKLVREAKRVVAKGEQVIDSAEAAAVMLRKTAGPLGAVKLIANIIESVTKHDK